jgi:acyl carrier protein
MEKETINDIVIKTINEYLKVMKEVEMEITGSTRLIGGNNQIESIDLVNIILDVEEAFRNNNIQISLTSEKAMSVKNSPFATIASLVDFLDNQINEKHE